MNNDELAARLGEEYVPDLPLDEIAELGFVPTSGSVPPHRNWGGKFQCVHCKSRGYVSTRWIAVPYWWGQRHGNNCRKRFQ